MSVPDAISVVVANAMKQKLIKRDPSPFQRASPGADVTYFPKMRRRVTQPKIRRTIGRLYRWTSTKVRDSVRLQPGRRLRQLQPLNPSLARWALQAQRPARTCPTPLALKLIRAGILLTAATTSSRPTPCILPTIRTRTPRLRSLFLESPRYTAIPDRVGLHSRRMRNMPCHSKRGEESLCALKPRKREIPRHAA